MFCPNCGNQLPDGAAFCSFCGSRTAAAAPSDSVSDRLATRRSEEAELERMIGYFSRNADLYAEYDELVLALDGKKLKKRKGFLVWAILAYALSAYIFTIGIVEGLRDPIIAASVNAVGASMFLFAFIWTSVEKTKNYNKAIDRFAVVSGELAAAYRGYGPCLLSAEFTNPSNLSAILDSLRSGRADTIKEAVNVLVNDARRYYARSTERRRIITARAAARGADAPASFAEGNLFVSR